MPRTLLRSSLTLLTLLALGLVEAPAAHACSCRERTDEALIHNADVIFEGIVTRVERDASTSFVRVSFDVTQGFRGALHETVELFTPPGAATCGVAFEEGSAYLVLATEDEDRRLETTLCAGTRAMNDAGSLRSALGSGTVPIDVADERVEPRRGPSSAASMEPTRAGCASCTVSGRPRRAPLGGLVLALGLVGLRRRARGR